MTDPTEDEVTAATRAEETNDEHVSSGADREPTPDEEAAAEATGDLDPSVAEAYKEQNERGAHVAGEGQID